MAQNKEQQAIMEAAEQPVKRPLGRRIIRAILWTAVTLAVVSVTISIVMFYTEFLELAVDKKEAMSDFIRLVIIHIVCMTIVTIGIILYMRRYARKSIVEPLGQIRGAVREYIVDRSDGSLDETHFFDLHLHTEDELERLALVLNDMESSIRTYVANLTNVTREKERISTELRLAERIQSTMLPSVFPPYPNRRELDIYANMNPAKEVGGDFYDFFLIDDDHLGLVMADVSGKGIPAALFMMMSRIMINSAASSGISPGRVLKRVNEKICENNDAQMFVTVWLGVLTISTGQILAANAGHEYPMLRKADGTFELIEDAHSFVVGGMEGVRYKEYSLTLERGGTLFLYTDGLTEATNEDYELFGTDRILEALNADPGISSRKLLQNMNTAVDAFVGTAEQADDLTMMAIRLRKV